MGQVTTNNPFRESRLSAVSDAWPTPTHMDEHMNNTRERVLEAVWGMLGMLGSIWLLVQIWSIA